MKSFHVEYKNYKNDYNLDLLIKNGKEHNLEKLKNTYINLFKTIEKMEQTDNCIILFNLNKYVTELEFELQRLWGFPENINYHRYWFLLPKCTCPKIDNNELIGSILKYYNNDCIIHGEETLNLVKREKKLKRIINYDK